MTKPIFIIVFLLLYSLNNLAQTSIVKDNLSGKEDGVPKLNSVDQLIAAYKGKIIFCSANKFVDLSTDGDYEPWVYDPGTNTLSILKDIVPLKASVPNKFVLSVDKLFFGATDEFFLVDRLFVTDGTKAGTLNMGDTINKLSGMLRNFSRNTIAALNGGVIFNAYIGLNAYSLWFSDGTPTGTNFINKDGFADNFVFHPKYNKVIFTQDSKFKISDGSFAGTSELNDLLNITSVASPSIAIGIFKDNFIMEAIDPNTGTFGLFMTNGISNQYSKLLDFGNSSGQVRNVVDIGNGKCLFSTKNGLFSTDGTSAGTFQIPNISPFKQDNFYTDLWTLFNGRVYFAASDANKIKGVELYATDGTIGGTELIMDINVGAGSSNPYNFYVYNKILYFSAGNATQGNELWQSDGTTSGTKILSDINLGTGSSNPQYITGLGDNLYFFASDGKSGYELWKFSGAKVGIENVRRTVNLEVYPTIVESNIFVKGEVEKITKIIIVDKMGQTINIQHNNSATINLGNLKLNPGMYFISFYSDESQVYSQKIIIP